MIKKFHFALSNDIKEFFPKIIAVFNGINKFQKRILNHSFGNSNINYLTF